MTGPASRGRRCERHGLAAGPDGWCALCKSESLPPPKRWSARLSIAVLAAIFLVCAALLAHRGFGVLATAVEREPAAQPELGPAASTVASRAPETTQPEPTEAQVTGQSFALDQPIPAPAAPALGALTPPLASSAPAQAQLLRQPGKPAPTEAELRAALSATPIVMYATTWCGVCRRARQFLSENGLRYQEIDADKTAGGWDKVEQLAGRRAVPVIVVDGVVTRGLSPTGVMKAVAGSMERRLGVTGIQFRSEAPN